MVTRTATPPERLLGSPQGELNLRIVGGSRDGQFVRIGSPKCTVGSAHDCTLRLRARGVRPVHCLIIRGRHTTVVRRWSPDTRLNGSTFTDAPLVVGDRLSIGPIELEVVAAGSRPASVAARITTGTSASPQAPAAASLTASNAGASSLSGKALRHHEHRRTKRLIHELRAARQLITERNETTSADTSVRTKQEVVQLLETERTSLQQRQAEWEEVRRRAEERLGERTKEMVEKLADLKSEQQSLAALRKQVEQERVTLKTERDKLRSLIGDQEQQQKQLEAARAKVDSARKQLEADLHDARAEGLTHAGAAFSDQEALDAFKRERQEWEAERRRREDRLRLRARQLEQGQETAEVELHEQQLCVDQEAEDVERLNERLQQTIAALDEGKKADRKKYEQQLADLSSEARRMEQQRRRFDDEKQAWDEQQQQDTSRLSMQSQQLQEQADELSRRQQQLDAHRQELEQAGHDHEQQVATDTEDANDRASQLAVNDEQLQRAIAALEEDKKAEQEQRQQRLDELSLEAQRLEQQRQQVDDEKQAWDEQQQQDTSRLSMQSQQLQEQADELSRRQQQLDEHRQELEQARHDHEQQVTADTEDANDRATQLAANDEPAAMARDFGDAAPTGNSIFEQLRRLQTPDDPEPTSSSNMLETVRVDSDPTPPDSIETQGSPAQRNDDREGDDSIESYMRRLLGRVQGGGHRESVDPESIKSIWKDASRDSEQESAADAAPAEIVPEMLKPGELKPRHTAPEMSSDIAMMRELANAAAQSAVDRYAARSQWSQIATSKLIVATVALVSGVYILVTQPAMTMPWFGGAMLALLVAAFWGLQFWLLAKNVWAIGNRKPVVNSERAEPTGNNDEPPATKQAATEK